MNDRDKPAAGYGLVPVAIGSSFELRPYLYTAGTETLALAMALSVAPSVSRLEVEAELPASQNVEQFNRMVAKDKRIEKLLFALKVASLRLRSGEVEAAEKVILDAINEDGRLSAEGEGK